MAGASQAIAESAADLWRWIGQTNPAMWTAAAGWTTTLVAIAASAAGLRHVKRARVLREEQAQPYVIAFMAPSRVNHDAIDFVVKNLGSTVARNVRIRSSPALQRTAPDSDQPEDVRLFDVLPVLVPGQEWRIFWDSGIARSGAGLEDIYRVRVTYDDSRGRAMKQTTAVLDWRVHRSRRRVSVVFSDGGGGTPNGHPVEPQLTRREVVLTLPMTGS